MHIIISTADGCIIFCTRCYENLKVSNGVVFSFAFSRLYWGLLSYLCRYSMNVCPGALLSGVRGILAVRLRPGAYVQNAVCAHSCMFRRLPVCACSILWSKGHWSRSIGLAITDSVARCWTCCPNVVSENLITLKWSTEVRFIRSSYRCLFVLTRLKTRVRTVAASLNLVHRFSMIFWNLTPGNGGFWLGEGQIPSHFSPDLVGLNATKYYDYLSIVSSLYQKSMTRDVPYCLFNCCK